MKPAQIKMYAKMGSRASFGMAAFELAKEMDNLMVLTADVSTSAGLDRYRKKYPDKFLDVGIAEQNMMGIATGLASEGYEVITTTFAPFQTMRCCEQIRVNLGYMNQKVIMVGLASGVVLGDLGFTHCNFEDIGILRSIPNITIISPADCFETIKATKEAIKHHQSIYIRLTGGANASIVYDKDYTFEIGKAVKLKDGDKISIIANGTMVAKALEVANILGDTQVINMHTIKPIDEEAIVQASKTGYIVTIEEHNIIGGLGSAVAEVISKYNLKVKHLILGIPDSYTKAASYSDLLDEYGLTTNKILDSIKEYKC
jgi:transketolase